MSDRIQIVDTSLRDGMHAVAHQFSAEDAVRIAKALDASRVDIIEVGHGDGLGGSSIQYGFSAASDADYIKAVSESLSFSRLAVLLLPGIGTFKNLKDVARLGVSVVRVATHATEADVAEQHIKGARDLGLDVVGFLMMSHMADPDVLAQQASLMASYGAGCVYVTDSAGAMLPVQVERAVKAVKAAVSVPVGHHSHNNMGLSAANSLAAIEAGATWIDGSCRGLGAGAGNTPTEVLAAVLKKSGYECNIDFFRIMDAAEDVIPAMVKNLPSINRDALTIGYAGVYSSFLLHARRAAKRFGVDGREILMEIGRLKCVGGQEDMIIDVACEMLRKEEN